MENFKENRSINSRIELKLKLVEMASYLSMDYDALEDKFKDELSELPLTQDESTRELMEGVLPSILANVMGSLEGMREMTNTPEKENRCEGCACSHEHSETTPETRTEEPVEQSQFPEGTSSEYPPAEVREAGY